MALYRLISYRKCKLITADKQRAREIYYFMQQLYEVHIKHNGGI
jgi:hypothetical protein